MTDTEADSETEREMTGIDVWIAGTIYVEAADEDEAATIIAQRYAGTYAKTNSLDLLDGPDIPLEGDDFLSGAITLYGLCSEAELASKGDQRELAAVPDLLAVLKQAIDDWEDWDSDAPVNGGDMVEWYGNWRKLAKQAVAKAEGK